jgi:hypothetical protein
MKASRPKVHLKDSDEPLLSFSGVTVRCGATLKHALPQFMVTEEADAMVKGMLIVGCCRACQRLDAPQGRVYIYGLSEGEEVREAGE